LTEKTSERSDFEKLLARLLEEDRIRSGRAPRPSKPQHKRRPVVKLILVSVSILIVVSGAWVYQDNSWRFAGTNGSGVPRAALLDQLSRTIPDPSFNDSVRATLVAAGYSLDYYSPAQVTIGFLQSLPLKGYSLIVVRAHSGSDEIYTSEQYTTSKYVFEQLTNQIVPVEVDNKVYFSITKNFVQDSMRGRFQGSLIILMGCSGLFSPDMAQAFLAKGAKAVVGWSGAVNAGHTDSATETLLQYLAQGNSLQDAVRLTSDKLGPDPVYGGHLAYYDFKVGFLQQIGAQLAGLGLLMMIVVPIALSPLIVYLIPRIFGRR